MLQGYGEIKESHLKFFLVCPNNGVLINTLHTQAVSVFHAVNYF